MILHTIAVRLSNKAAGQTVLDSQQRKVRNTKIKQAIFATAIGMPYVYIHQPVKYRKRKDRELFLVFFLFFAFIRHIGFVNVNPQRTGEKENGK